MCWDRLIELEKPKIHSRAVPPERRRARTVDAPPERPQPPTESSWPLAGVGEEAPEPAERVLVSD